MLNRENVYKHCEGRFPNLTWSETKTAQGVQSLFWFWKNSQIAELENSTFGNKNSQIQKRVQFMQWEIASNSNALIQKISTIHF